MRSCRAHLPVLVYNAMNATLLHSLAVVYVIRFKTPVLQKYYSYRQQSHCYSNY